MRAAARTSLGALLAVAGLVVGLVGCRDEQGRGVARAEAVAKDGRGQGEVAGHGTDARDAGEPGALVVRDAPPADIAAVRGTSGAFAWDLLRAVAARKPGTNVILSTASVRLAGGLVYAGARGTTETALAKALSFPLPHGALLPAQGGSLSPLLSRTAESPVALTADRTEVGAAVRISAAAFVSSRLPIEDAWKKSVASVGAHTEALDFQSDAAASGRRIQQWIEGTTGGLLGASSPDVPVDAMTGAILAATALFQAPWARPFSPGRTATLPFTREDGRRTEASFMQDSRDVLLAEDGETLAVQLPYGGTDLNFVAVLPKHGKLAAVERAFSGAALERLLRGGRLAHVELRVPRFAFGNVVDLQPILRQRGGDAPFTSSADFSGISQGSGLRIAYFVHGARIDVDERGTRAAAATVIAMDLPSARLPGRVVSFDVPFAFALRHGPTGELLFVGHVHDPASHGQ